MKSNKILRNMMRKVNKSLRRELAIFLSVDIQNCEPELNPQYKKSMIDNLFIYLDENNRILGFTQGYAILRQQNNKYAIYADYIRNRKNLLARCTNVLMFTPEMRTFKINQHQYKSTWKEQQDHKQNLKERLQQYKSNKYKNVSHEQIKEIIQNIISSLNNDIFTNNLTAKLNTSKIGFYNNSSIKLLRSFSNIAEEYILYYSEHQSSLNYLSSNNSDYNEKDSYYYDKVESAKSTILYWNKLLND